MGDLLDEAAKQIVGPSSILIIDIERLGGTAEELWELKTRYIPPHKWLEWPRTICWSAQWYGQKRMLFASEWGDGRVGMLERAWDLYDQADIVVTYNGDRFDHLHLKGDWATMNPDPGRPRPWKSVDLYKLVRREFGFESKSLHEVARRFGHPGKEMHYSHAVAKAAVNGDAKAQRLLRRYNGGDITLLRWVYDRTRGWNASHPHIGWSGEKKCNSCGSDALVLQATPYRADQLIYPQYRCDNCGAPLRGLSNIGRIGQTRGVR